MPSSDPSEQLSRLSHEYRYVSLGGIPALLERCRIWEEAKQSLPTQAFERFCKEVGVPQPSIYSHVMNVMSARYARLSLELGANCEPAAVLALISMLNDDSLDQIVRSMDTRRHLRSDELLKQIASGAWEKQKSQMLS